MSENLDWKNVLLASAFHMSHMLESLLKTTKEYWRSYDRQQKRNKPRVRKPGDGIGPYKAMPKHQRKEAIAAMQAVIDEFGKERERKDDEPPTTTSLQWKQLADRLYELCVRHPDGPRQSGGNFDGALDQMAMAATMEAADYARYQSGGSTKNADDRMWKVEGSAAKMLRYMFLAFSQAKSKDRASCLEWVARNIDFNQYAASALKAHEALYEEKRLDNLADQLVQKVVDPVGSSVRLSKGQGEVL